MKMFNLDKILGADGTYSYNYDEVGVPDFV